MATREQLPADEQKDIVLFVSLGGLVAGAFGVWTAVHHGPSPMLVVRYIVVGLAYLAVGYWLSTRGHGNLGLLCAITGALWFAPEYEAASGQSLAVGLGILLESAYLATFAHAVLAYPSGSIRNRTAVWFVRAAYVVTLGGGAARALTYQPYYWQSCDCPHNGFAVSHSQSLYDAINNPYRILLLILALLFIGVVGTNLRSAKDLGVASRPLWALLIGTTLVVISGILRELLDLSRTGLILVLWVEGIGFLIALLPLLLPHSREHEQPELATASDFRANPS